MHPKNAAMSDINRALADFNARIEYAGEYETPSATVQEYQLCHPSGNYPVEQWGTVTIRAYEFLIQTFEGLGMTTSDAQGCADAAFKI